MRRGAGWGGTSAAAARRRSRERARGRAAPGAANQTRIAAQPNHQARFCALRGCRELLVERRGQLPRASPVRRGRVASCRGSASARERASARAFATGARRRASLRASRCCAESRAVSAAYFDGASTSASRSACCELDRLAVPSTGRFRQKYSPGDFPPRARARSTPRWSSSAASSAPASSSIPIWSRAQLDTPALVLAAWAAGGAVAIAGAFAYAELGAAPAARRRPVRLPARGVASAGRIPLRLGAAVHDRNAARWPPSRSRSRSTRCGWSARRTSRRGRSRSPPSCVLSVDQLRRRQARQPRAERVRGAESRRAGRADPVRVVSAAHAGLADAPAASTTRRRRAGVWRRADSDPVRVRRLAERELRRRGNARSATAPAASLIVGTLAVVAIYLLVNVAYLRTLGLDGLAATTTPAADAAGRWFGAHGERFVAAAIAISTFGFLNLAVLAPTRVYYAMAADGAFLPALARLHPRFQHAGRRDRAAVRLGDRADAHRRATATCSTRSSSPTGSSSD